jgi:putative ubiquitin-RnfH superfamily antitoxin RatB of RatAB toxin-antitoxin module
VITVLLVEAWADRVTRRELSLPDGATISDALVAAALAADDVDVGLWGKLVPLDTVLLDGDRLERYRGLIADPKQARHQRATVQGYRWQGRTRRAARTS